MDISIIKTETEEFSDLKTNAELSEVLTDSVNEFVKDECNITLESSDKEKDSSSNQQLGQQFIDVNNSPFYQRNKDAFWCNICGFTTKYIDSLKFHIANHRGDKPFACSKCNYRSCRKGDLKQHINNLHTKKKLKYVCSLCCYGTTRLGHFNRHMLVHNNEKPFVCGICGSGFVQKPNLVRHINKHNLVRQVYKHDTMLFLKNKKICKSVKVTERRKPYSCNVCFCQCVSLPILKRHIRMHCEKTLLKCSTCSYATSRKDSLIQHFIHKHSKQFQSY